MSKLKKINKQIRKYKVGKPSKLKNWDNSDCIPFNIISHVSHIDNALNILTKDKLCANAFENKSLFNNDSILVNWLSPNRWGNGYRYGNIKYNFEIEKLVKNKYCYWVEDVLYDIPACRILLTDKKYNNLCFYDPRIGDGPWWYDESKNINYFNSQFCLEFMFEGDIDLSECLDVDFVSHHGQFCSINRLCPEDCSDLGLSYSKAGARFISKLISNNQSFRTDLFLTDTDPSDYLLSAWSSFINKCHRYRKNIKGNLSHTNEHSKFFARALYNAYGNSLFDEFKHFIEYFKSIEDVEISTAKLYCEKFEIKNYEVLLRELI